MTPKEVKLSISSQNTGSMGWKHYIKIYGHPTIRDGLAFASALENIDQVESIVSYINSCLHSRKMPEKT